MDIKFFREDRFYMLIAVVTIFSVMAVYFADYTYLLSVRYVASESGIEIAVVVAVIFSIIKTGELLVSLLSGSIIRSYGMKTSLLMLPVILVCSTFIGFSTSLLFINIPFFIVIFLLVNKWNERVVRKGVTVPSMKVVYQVTDPEHRAQLQTSIDGTISQYATILAGIFLWILSISFSSHNLLFFLRIVAFVYLIAFALWSWFTLKLYDVYKIKIVEYLHKFRGGAAQTEAEVIDQELGETEQHEAQPANNKLVKEAIEKPLVLDLDAVAGYISFYNPTVKNNDRRNIHFAQGKECLL